MRRITGDYERDLSSGEEVSSFVPKPLPPRDPPLDMDAQLVDRLGAAENALARLELAGQMVPSLDWFIYAFVRKEAVTSSQIEGTQASLVDLFRFESESGSSPDVEVQEICNYLDALSYARGELAQPHGLPLCMRLLNQAHRRLMYGVRGADKQPDEVRRSQKLDWAAAGRATRSMCRHRLMRSPNC